MYQLFGLKAVMATLLPVVLFFGFVLFSLFPPTGWGDVASLCSTTAGISVTVFVLLGQSCVFLKFWKIPLVQKHFFPYVHGKWEGQIQSNWSVISAIRNAAASSSNSVNVDTIDMHTVGSMDKDVTVEITATFLYITMKLIPKDGYTDSETIFVKPEKNGDGGYPCLYYMYRSRANNPLSTDVSIHYGAARMDIRSDSAGNPNIIGNYWTERNWHKGMNTAGKLDVHKVS